jgi:NAD(P)-dependent dehydrogenase (short-subunit alcohol dehydrogenase family)
MSWDPRSIPSQAGKTFVVTGGNAGIGYFISEQLAAAGGHVIIACRSAAKADAAIAAIHARTPEAQLEHVALDLSSYASVRSAAAALTGRRIDAIIENAGSIMPSKKRETTVDGNEVMFGTNHLGHFLLTALLYPTLAATPGARVVTMGSGATRLTTAHRPPELVLLCAVRGLRPVQARDPVLRLRARPPAARRPRIRHLARGASGQRHRRPQPAPCRRDESLGGWPPVRPGLPLHRRRKGPGGLVRCSCGDRSGCRRRPVLGPAWWLQRPSRAAEARRIQQQRGLRGSPLDRVGEARRADVRGLGARRGWP